MSRVIVKNLPKYINKERLKQLFSVFGTITDTRMIYAQGDVFRRIAFVGFSNEDEAENAIKEMNQTYIDTCKISVELAKSVNDQTLERPWSRYSKESSAYTKREKDRIERLKIIGEFKNKDLCPPEVPKKDLKQKQKTKKLSKHETMILESCGIGVEDQEQFNEYMSLNGMKPIELPSENTSEQFGTIADTDDHSTTDVCYTAKLSNLRPNIKLKRLLKFFKCLDVVDIRILPPGERKKTCIAFADFSNETDLEKAIKMSGKVLKGNTVKILESNIPSRKKQPHTIALNKTEDCEQTLLDTGRLFVTNLPHVCDSSELKQLFENYGPVVEINMPINKDTSKPSGFAFVTFMLPENAVVAFNHLNNFIFKGRLIRLIPAKSDEVDDFVKAVTSGSTNSYKLKKMRHLKQVNANMAHTWNTLFINQNTVANILSKRLGVTKEQLLLDPSFANNPAVSIAAGETALVNETKQFLEVNGVNLDSFGQKNDKEKSDCILLAKNLPENVTSSQLMEFILSKTNSNDDSKTTIKPRIIMPPYGVTAIIKFEDSNAAKLAFKKLAFTRFRFTPLYLEWAPKETLSNVQQAIVSKNDGSSSLNKPQITPISGCVVFMKNLNPSTTEETIKNCVEDVVKVVRVTLARKDPNDLNRSLGYGFIELSNAADAKQCVKMLQGCVIDEFTVELKLSDRKVIPKAPVSSNEMGSKSLVNQTDDGDAPKLLVRNIPFEATRNDVMELFKTYGNVKSVRLPQKLSATTSALRNQHRGFAFVEFLTLEDAKYCFECMRYSTHLYGRRLVLEWANDSTSISNIRKRTAAHFNQEAIAGKDVSSRIAETLDNM